MSTLAIIPARGGSKGVPRKNIVPVAGRPLIAWTISAAMESEVVDRAIVSTDDPETREVALELGCEAPFLRPAELATDTATDWSVYRHAVDWLEERGEGPDCVVWLRPTTPLRLASDIDGAVEVLEDTGADAVRSVCEAEHHPYWMKRFVEGRLEPLLDGHDETAFPRRQMLPPVYQLNGAVDAWLCRSADEMGALFRGTVAGYLMPVERSLDIDTPFDLRVANLLLSCERDPVS